MREHWPQANNRRSLTQSICLGVLIGLLFSCGIFFSSPSAYARSAATPWTDQMSFQNLVYGSSSTADVVQVMGQPPDDIVRAEQMSPVVENYYYYDPDKSGAASVFVFEAGFLVGFQLKTAGNQYIDLTYLIPDRGDRYLNSPGLGGYQYYYPYFPLTSFR